jgi:hypothetical protein
MLEGAVRDAQGEGLLDPEVDPAQLAFELDAYLMLANAQFVAGGEATSLDRARRAIAERLERAGAPSASVS